MTDPDIDTTARAEEQRRLKRVLKEIEVQIRRLAEVAKDKAVVTGTQSTFPTSTTSAQDSTR